MGPGRTSPPGRRGSRPARFPALVAVVALVLAGCWPSWGGGTQRSGHNPFEDLLTLATVGGLGEQWRWRDPAGVSELVTSAHGVHVLSGNRLVTINEATGTQRWDAELFPPSIPQWTGELVADDGALYVGLIGYRGFTPTHTVRYDAATGAGGSSVAGFTAVPFYDRLPGTSSAGVPGQVFNLLHVAFPSEPSRSWGAILDSSFGGVSVSRIATGFRYLYVVVRGTLLAYPYDRPAGCVQPPGSPGEPFISCPAAWRRDGVANLTPALARDERDLAVMKAGLVEVLDPGSGALRWTGALPGAGTPTTSAAISDAVVAALSEQGGTHRLAVFPRSGCATSPCAPSWTALLPGAPAGPPVLAGGLVWVAAGSSVLAYPAAGCGAATCAPVWSADLGAEAADPPAVSVGQVFVPTADGVVAYGLPASARRP